MELAEYLMRRIKECGVGSVHGVPGDFNLVSLDYIEKCGLQWVGNCNELNAGHAADGYARVNGISALMTVMGVGELPALSAIAGAYAEYVPIIHIVGKPSRRAQADRLYLHHTLGDGDFDVFAQMSAAVSCTAVSLEDPKTAPAQIDHAIQQCWIQSRPVLILLPTDLVPVSVNDFRLTGALDLSCKNNEVEEVALVDGIVKELHQAANPVLVIGGYGIRQDMTAEILGLAELWKIPTCITPMGKGLVDETLPFFRGLYVGQCSEPSVAQIVQSADLIISIGDIQSDLSTAGFTNRIDPHHTIALERNRASLRGEAFSKLHLKGVLQMLMARWTEERLFCDHPRKDTLAASDMTSIMPGEGSCYSTIRQFLARIMGPFRTQHSIAHKWLWPALGQWLGEGDVVIAETGSPNFGIWRTPFPAESSLITQYLWGSIGYSMGACQGAAQAVRDSGQPQRRTVLFIGDGSFQVSCQELSTLIRLRLAPVIFIICNNGYTTERYVNGWQESYNDIQPWQHRQLLTAFGAPSHAYQAYRVRTREQLQRLLESRKFNNTSVLQLVEVCMSQDDAPEDLIKLAESLKNRNA
ncbi:Pyruvate decarboxylase 1 [Aspergillus nanangensis]|uniref:Pyruvate decarboxylase n=1 Tax=Aspergillus nanangensis TaxID=2582783 RepID=A0AAD4CE95_ASPNN|nr:Pyruvate decarboxylase 1 [Aspergillus nanangensis]